MIIIETLFLFILLVFAATLLSYGAEKFAEKYGANFTGSILLALITTLPEYMFVIWASLKGHFEVAVGNAVAACTLLITLGYGLVILFATTGINRQPIKIIELSKATQVDAIYLVITALIAFLLAWEGNNSFDLKDGIILVALFGGYVYHVWKVGMKFLGGQEASVSKRDLIKGIIYLAVGGIMIFFLSEPFVEAMLKLAKQFNISPVTIAILIGPLASEMPEKATAYITVLRNPKLAEISVCNFIGSKVNHNSLLLGTMPLIALIAGKGNVSPIITLPFILMTSLTFIAGASVARRRLDKWQGIFFTSLYLLILWVAFYIRKAP